MAEVIGPTSTMPGSSHRVPEGQKCDDHPDRNAVARLQGETDSMGAELFDVCQECLDAYRQAKREAGPNIGKCEWCKATDVELRKARDYEEGTRGRIYEVCGPCIARQNQLAAEEMARMDEDEDDYDDDDRPLHRRYYGRHSEPGESNDD